MKSRLPVAMRLQRPPFFAALIIVAVAMLQDGCTGCWIDSTPTPNQRLEAALIRRQAAQAAPARPKVPASTGLQCPPLGGSMISSTPPANGGHRVTLSWKASAPPDSKHSAAAGYCIYRGAPGDPNPGLINFVPLPGTSCVDDMVANSQRYSYVVRAINSNGISSIASSPAPVQIPATGQSKPPSGASPPLCRQPVATR